MNTLAELEDGQSANVANVHGDDAISTRLMEMGIVPGVSIQKIASAMLGDPIEFDLRGYRLSLRKTEAARVEIAEG